MAKRCFDVIVALIGLILLTPVFLMVALAIKLDSPGPIFYIGKRIGKDGMPFGIIKFRTMVDHADRMGAALTQGQDPRVTRVGRVLRKWKLDELPQMLNVLRGEMSVVGPRPEAPCYVEHYTPEQRRVLQAKPGITGLTQVRFRHEESCCSTVRDVEEEYIREIMPHKLALDLEYIENQTLLLDLKLIARTFVCLFETDEWAKGEQVVTAQ